MTLSDISMNDFSYTTLFISVKRMKLRIFTCVSQCLRFLLTYTLQYPTEVASLITKDEYALSGD
jgi:hypothetical protein